MKIVFIRSNPVDPYPRLEKAANYLMNAGHEVQVLAWDRSKKYRAKKEVLRLLDGKCNIVRFGIPGIFGGGLKHNLLSLLKFQKEITYWLIKNRKNYDVVHAYDLDTGFTGLLIAKLLRKKIVYDIPDYYIDSHGLSNSKIGVVVKKIEDMVISKADAVIICTEKRKEQIQPAIPKKLIVIHNSPVFYQQDKVSLEKIMISNTDKLKIVYVGILTNNRFIKEIADTVMQRDDCEFHIAGFGELENYFIQLSSSNDDIYYYGKIPYLKTLQLESESDVIPAIYNPIIPNHYYAAPNKFYESLMLGKSIIMAQNTGMDEYVKEYSIGEIIEYNTESFNQAIDNLISKRKEWKEISYRAKKLYFKEFSAEIMGLKLVDLYIDLERY